MISQMLVNAMLAVVTAELFHAVSEMFSARFKAGQLLAWSSGRPAREMPVDIDTRPKAYAVLVSVAVVLTGLSFAVFTAVDLSTRTAVVYTAIVVAATYAITGVGMDGFHVLVGKVGADIRAERPARTH